MLISCFRLFGRNAITICCCIDSDIPIFVATVRGTAITSAMANTSVMLMTITIEFTI